MVSRTGIPLLKVLVLAPHPYFIVRGTPIDLDLVLRALSELPEIEVDALVYADGEDRHYPDTRIMRTPRIPGFGMPGPGFSLRKLFLDALLAVRALWLCARHRYDFVHAGEEAVFVAMLIRRLFRIPYAYDLDSSIAQQLVESRPRLAPFAGVFSRFEARAIREALWTFPVCEALADLCRRRGAAHVTTLHDISQLDRDQLTSTGRLRALVGDDAPIVLYVGNLERYQGVDLLLDGFAWAAREAAMHLVIVGGTPAERARGDARSREAGVAERCHWLPPEPLEHLAGLIAEATILAAPRLRGINTPMKVFPFLHSGKPVLLTRLPTHTQLLDDRVACLVDPTPEALGAGLLRLLGDPELREALGRAGVAFVERGHTYEAYRERIHAAYASIAGAIASGGNAELDARA